MKIQTELDALQRQSNSESRRSHPIEEIHPGINESLESFYSRLSEERLLEKQKALEQLHFEARNNYL